MTTIYKNTLAWKRNGRAFWNVVSSANAALREDAILVGEHRRATCRHLSSHGGSLRRKREYKTMYTDGPLDPFSPHFGKLQEPYQHGEESAEAYLNKTALSPWVPLSDAICRKLFDLALAGPDDIHVDLGSGDGRVNFHAIQYGVKQSTGIDVDENIVQVAKDRMAKRHPPPPLEFIVADLLDERHPAWKKVQEATIITMYFAEPGLQVLRPLLERKLAGKEYKIVTAGYEMRTWNPSMTEVIMGTKLFLYEWGKPINEMDPSSFLADDMLHQKFREVANDPIAYDKFKGANIVDRTFKHPISGYNPNIWDEEFDDDDEYWSLETDDEEDETKTDAVGEKDSKDPNKD